MLRPGGTVQCRIVGVRSNMPPKHQHPHTFDIRVIGRNRSGYRRELLPGWAVTGNANTSFFVSVPERGCWDVTINTPPSSQQQIAPVARIDSALILPCALIVACLVPFDLSCVVSM